MGQKITAYLPVYHLPSNIRTGLDSDIESLLSVLFKKRKCFLLKNGRIGIELFLKSMKLNRNDEVFIATTFDLPNVSSCVTCTIFNQCKPSRVITDNTKLIFIIHELGVAHPDTAKLVEFGKNHGIPVLEDCAHSWNSSAAGLHAGSNGDLTIISFPKILPVHSGGALLVNGNYSISPDADMLLPESELIEIKKYISFVDEYSQARRHIYARLARFVKKHSMTPLFEINDEISPYMFPFHVEKAQEFLRIASMNNVECGQWHGTDIIVLPCNQFLTNDDIAVIESSIEQYAKLHKTHGGISS